MRDYDKPTSIQYIYIYIYILYTAYIYKHGILFYNTYDNGVYIVSYNISFIAHIYSTHLYQRFF